MHCTLVSYGSWLLIEPFMDELVPVLRFFHVSQKMKLVKYGDKQWETRDGFKREYENIFFPRITDETVSGMVTYRGVLQLVIEHLQKFGHTFTYERRGRPFPVPDIRPEHFRNLDERSKLKDLLIHLLASEGGALTEGATGIGKTSVIETLVRVFHRPVVKEAGQRILIVTDAAAVVQHLWMGLSEVFKGSDILVGITQGAHVSPRDVTISTVKMLHLHDPEKVGVAIYDECHGAASSEPMGHLLNMSNALKFGLSGTIEDRSDGKELLLEGLFGPIAYKIDDKEAEALGWVSPQHVYLVSVPKGPNIYGKNEHQVEKQGIWYNDTRNGIIRDVCLAAPEDKQLLLFVRTVEHLEELMAKWLPEGFEIMHSGLPARERRKIQTAFVNGKIQRLIATDCLKQGVDTKNLFVLINANWVSSRVGVGQRRGRNRRLHDDKEFGIIVDFQDEWMETIIKEEQDKTKTSSTLEGFELEPQDEPHLMLLNKAKTRRARYKKAGDKIFKVQHAHEIKFNNFGTPPLLGG